MKTLIFKVTPIVEVDIVKLTSQINNICARYEINILDGYIRVEILESSNIDDIGTLIKNYFKIDSISTEDSLTFGVKDDIRFEFPNFEFLDPTMNNVVNNIYWLLHSKLKNDNEVYNSIKKSLNELLNKYISGTKKLNVCEKVIPVESDADEKVANTESNVSKEDIPTEDNADEQFVAAESGADEKVVNIESNVNEEDIPTEDNADEQVVLAESVADEKVANTESNVSEQIVPTKSEKIKNDEANITPKKVTSKPRTRKSAGGEVKHYYHRRERNGDVTESMVLLDIMNPALQKIDPSKELEAQLPEFLKNIGLESDDVIVGAFMCSFELEKINYENLAAKLIKKFPDLNSDTIIENLKSKFKNWDKREGIIEEHPKVSIISLLKIFVKNFSRISNDDCQVKDNVDKSKKHDDESALCEEEVIASDESLKSFEPEAVSDQDSDEMFDTAEGAVLSIILPALKKIDRSREIGSQLTEFFKEIKMKPNSYMQDAFISACLVKKVAYYSILAELSDLYPHIREGAMKIKLQVDFNKWLSNYPKLKEKYPNIDIITLLKVFAQEIK